MNQLQTFKNELFEVSAKIENGQILFDAEQVAICLGITTEVGGKTYVRWKRVNSYLPKDLPQVAKGDLIPEPLVYKLAFKASNELAEKFQDWLAIEVIPTIRKTGGYVSEDREEEFIRNYFPSFSEEVKQAMILDLKKQNSDLKQKLKLQKPKVLFADAVETSESSILVGELAKILIQNGVKTVTINGREKKMGQNNLFIWLRDNGYLCKKKGEMFNLPTQYSIDNGLFEIKKRTQQNPDGSIRVTRTPKVTGKGQIYFVNKFLESKTTDIAL